MRIIILPVFLLMSILLLGQETQNFNYTIESSVFDSEREIRVYLPKRYLKDTTTEYTTTYILDAQSDQFWNMAIHNLEYLVNNYSIIPTIMVGIVSENRGSDFEPPATQLQSHIGEEVVNLIEENYRVNSFKTVIGHSWGGAFIGTTLFGENRDLFNAYIGISPSFGSDENIIVPAADSLLELGTVFNKILYFSHGDVGRREKEFGGYVNDISRLLGKYNDQSIAYQPECIKGTDHWQIVIPSFNQGMLHVSRQVFADQDVIERIVKNDGNLEVELDKFNSGQFEKYGYVTEMSGGYLNFVANDFRDLEDYETSLVIYKLAQSLNPSSVKIQLNIADTYDKLGDKVKALPEFKKTLEMLEKKRDEVSERYYNNTSKWLKKKIQEEEGE